jgi:hypothetical protein
MSASSAGKVRDAAVRRLRRLNRTVIAASAILIGVFSDAAANAIPGPTAPAQQPSPSYTPPADPAPQQQLAPPPAPPVYTPAPAQTSSGGS